MKVQNQKSIRSRQGFTLVEMLGVLAIIAILISVIAVGVLSAINRARIVATTTTIKNVETAVTGYVALANSGGTVPLTEGGAVPTWAGGTAAVGVATDGDGYTVDQILISSGLQEKALSWRVGTDGTTLVVPTAEPKFILSRRAFSTAIAQAGTAAPTLNAAIWPTVNRVESAAITATGLPTATPLTAADFNAAPQFLVDGTTALTSGRVVYAVLMRVALKDAQKLSQELNGALDDTESTPLIQRRGRFIFDATGETAGTVDCFYYIASF